MRFELSARGTFDALARWIVDRLKGTKRMLIFDEADLLHYRAMETIRPIHDATGCPVLFAGKPKIYERLGFRALGECFTNPAAGLAWLRKDFNGSTPWDLLMAKRAGQVVHVLKTMIARSAVNARGHHEGDDDHAEDV